MHGYAECINVRTVISFRIYFIISDLLIFMCTCVCVISMATYEYLSKKDKNIRRSVYIINTPINHHHSI